jgi:hypothetical protein
MAAFTIEWSQHRMTEDIMNAPELRPIEALLEELDEYTGFTKYDLVDEAVARREEITPHLLAILERIKADPEQWYEGEHDIACYAMILLAHFGETRAHRLIVDIFSIPEPLQDEMFGDFNCETLPALLIRTCGGSTDGIRELILNLNASAFCRWSACTALSYAVVAGYAERDEVVSFLVELLRNEQMLEDYHFVTGVVDTLIDLHPAEVMDDIRRIYADGIVDETFADLDYIERKAMAERDDVLASLRDEYEVRASADIHRYMSWWDEPGKREAKRLANAANKERKQKTSRRKKNKQAKKSRRRNR